MASDLVDEGEPRNTYGALTKLLGDLGCELNVNGCNAIWECLKARFAELERLRGMIEDKHGPILDADTFLMEQCRALREKLKMCENTLEAIRDCPCPRCPPCKNSFDAARHALREIESAPASAPQKLEAENGEG